MIDIQFDDSLKNIIRDHRSPVPDDMWERIIQKEDKNRKGFLFFFRWFPILILTACLGSYLLFDNTKQNLKPVKHDLPIPDKQTTHAGEKKNKETVNPEKNLMPYPQPLVE